MYKVPTLHTCTGHMFDSNHFALCLGHVFDPDLILQAKLAVLCRMQISSLTKENKILIQQADKNPSRSVSHDGRGNDKDLLSSKHGFSSATHTKESKEASDVSATSVVVGVPL